MYYEGTGQRIVKKIDGDLYVYQNKKTKNADGPLREPFLSNPLDLDLSIY